jgi:hypothetical protein
MRRLAKTFIIAVFIGQLGCSTEKSNDSTTHFTGDLFFKLISLGSFYQADSLQIAKFNHYLDSLKRINPNSLTGNDRETIDIFDGLRRHGLFEKPFFHIRVDSLTSYIVYVDTIEYKKIKDFARQELINENKKVKIELTGGLVNLGTLRVIDCRTIDKVEKLDGKTFWKK